MRTLPTGAPVLVVTPGIHAARAEHGLILDDKAVSGLEQYVRSWPGAVRCVFREGPADTLLFAREWQTESLPCEVELIPRGSVVPEMYFGDAAVVMACAENHLDLPLAATCRRLDIPLIYVIENTIGTRLKIAAVEQSPPLRRAKAAVWELMTEIRRRAAFRLATGLAVNGVAATHAYAGHSKNVMTFFDNRMTPGMMATQQELSSKLARLTRGAPLRLGFSGRLERLKGADHLIAVARCLADAGQPFSLDIFGTGSLQRPMRDELARLRLEGQVTMHGAVDFQSELVPYFRTNIDLFVCCHRQSDPSCTYLEAMACAVPIAGYGNAALRGLLEYAKAGVATSMDEPERLAHAILALSSQRESLAAMMREALALASEHDFESTFRRRIEQCLAIAARPPAQREAPQSPIAELERSC